MIEVYVSYFRIYYADINTKQNVKARFGYKSRKSHILPSHPVLFVALSEYDKFIFY